MHLNFTESIKINLNLTFLDKFLYFKIEYSLVTIFKHSWLSKLSKKLLETSLPITVLNFFLINGILQKPYFFLENRIRNRKIQ